MPEIKNKAFIFRRNLFIFFIAILFVFSPASRPAEAWEAFAAASWKFVQETIRETIKGIQLGAAKKAAVMALQKEATALITGKSSGGPMFISDWKAYLIKQPRNAANLAINAYIDKAVSGRGSITGYRVKGSEGIGGGNYASQLVRDAKKLTSKENISKMTYVGNPSQMFADGQKDGFKNLNLYLSGINNPWAFNMNVQAELDSKKAELEKIAQAKAIAGQGFLGKESEGKTIAPGVLIKDYISKIQNMGIDVIVNADNLPEIIGSVVSQTINQTMMQGIGQMQAIVHKEVSAVRAKAGAQINTAVKLLGPGAKYDSDIPDTAQQTPCKRGAKCAGL